MNVSKLQGALNDVSIEADVVFLYYNAQTDAVVIEPHWECELTEAECLDHMISHGAKLADDFGTDITIATFVDRR